MLEHVRRPIYPRRPMFLLLAGPEMQGEKMQPSASLLDQPICCLQKEKTRFASRLGRCIHRALCSIPQPPGALSCLLASVNLLLVDAIRP